MSRRSMCARWIAVAVAVATAGACSSPTTDRQDSTTMTDASAAATDAPQPRATGAQPPTTTATATAPVTPTRVTYGDDPSQFGDLWMPSPGAGAVPVVILVHGGFWRAAYGLDLMNPLAADLVRRGVAAWNIEYRRVGMDGGGYPGTLDDVAAAVDRLAELAPMHHLDLADVTVVGHSAGGHLALWIAGRGALPAGAPGASPGVTPRLGIGQGPVFNLTLGDAEGLGGGAVTDFMGGSASSLPAEYAIATPSVTAGVPLFVVRGTADDIVPAAFAVPDPSGAQPADLRVVDVPGADHFDLIDPTSDAWQAVTEAIGLPSAAPGQ